jgi:hypothetical protein
LLHVVCAWTESADDCAGRLRYHTCDESRCDAGACARWRAETRCGEPQGLGMRFCVAGSRFCAFPLEMTRAYKPCGAREHLCEADDTNDDAMIDMLLPTPGNRNCIYHAIRPHGAGSVPRGDPQLFAHNARKMMFTIVLLLIQEHAFMIRQCERRADSRTSATLMPTVLQSIHRIPASHHDSLISC